VQQLKKTWRLLSSLHSQSGVPKPPLKLWVVASTKCYWYNRSTGVGRHIVCQSVLNAPVCEYGNGVSRLYYCFMRKEVLQGKAFLTSEAR